MQNSAFDTPFQNIMQSFDEQIHSYDPFANMIAEGLSLPDKLRNRLINEGSEYLAGSYEPIYARDYMQFVRTGDRSDFEEKYFSRRHRLCALVTAELAEGKGRFLDDIIDGIYLIGEESTWVLPAHNTYVRDTPQLILPDTQRPILDLFSCETSALLATTYYLLKQRLDIVSDQIGKYIFSLINDRLLRSYLEDHFWWMGNGDEPMCNWTPWCTQNVLLSVFLLPFDDDIRRKTIKQAAYSLDCFLKDYGEDGCCDEGAQYYRHAGLCLYHCIDILNDVTGNAFIDLFSMPKIINIASYIVNVHAGGEYYVNFSDCSAKAGRMGVREFLFGKACHLDALMRASADDFDHDCSLGDPLSDESLKLNLYFRVLTADRSKEVLAYHNNTAGKPPFIANDIYYPSVGLMVARSSRFVLAAKAGDNADNHNHNDTGSFILYMDGNPVFADIGVETYSKKTFSDDRYDIWTMQSGYHNLPTIMGLDQKAGEEYRATSVKCDITGTRKIISMHLEGAYPLQGVPEDTACPLQGVPEDTACPLPDKTAKENIAKRSDTSQVSYIRCITLDAADETVTLTDTTNCDDVILNFITYEDMNPADDPGTYLLGNTVIRIRGASVLSIETLPITDPRLKLAWDHDLNRIRLRMEDTEFTMTVSPAGKHFE